MRIILRCGGVLRSSPERDLVDDYLKRASGLVQSCGFHSIAEEQVDLKKCKTRAEETDKIISARSTSHQYIVLDERGKSLTSKQIAKTLNRLKDDGVSETIFVIGGADGFEPSQLPSNAMKLSFGSQVWPHKLVRIMLAEQMYRALSIMTGSPYHRD